MPDLNVLTINTGSSSLKMTLYSLDAAEKSVLTASVDRIGSSKSRIRISDQRNESKADREERIPNHGAALRAEQHALFSNVDGVGHRVVLGDRRCSQPQLINGQLLSILNAHAELAPDHLPQVIDSIEAVTRVYPSVPQIACFDSAFHSRMPRTSQMYALPRRFLEEGISRYGFHGLSCEYIMQELTTLDARASKGRVVVVQTFTNA